MPRWTDAQQAAIQTRGVNLLVSASAGSGKTAVLVERVLALMREGESLSHMLLCTFTKAAAAEMRQRIRLAVEGDEVLCERSLEVEQAAITTLHSFCSTLLTDFFVHAGAAPGARVFDTATANSLRQEALSDAIELLFAQQDEDFLALDEAYGPPEKLEALALSLYGFALAQPDPLAWLARKTAMYAPEGDRSPWHKQLRLAALRTLKSALARVEDALAKGMLPEAYEETFRADHGMLTQAMALTEALDDYSAALEKLATIFAAITWPRLPACKDPEREAAQKARNDAKDALKKFAKSTQALRQEDIPAMLPAMRGLEKLVCALHEGYARKKHQHSGIDFSDMEHGALRALSHEEVQQVVQVRYKHIFVDEYQDISPIQEAILSFLCAGANGFFVGDIKQSIYRFRMAKPALFLAKYHAYPLQAGSQRIDLNANFRSRPTILHATNAVFAPLMGPENGQPPYDESAALVPGLVPRTEDPPVEMHLLLNGEDDGDESGIEKEARLIASRIQALYGADYEDTKAGGARPLRYRDMVILMRSMTKAADLADVLARLGIPTLVQTGSALDALEVRLALCCLRAIHNRRQDIPLLGTLQGPGGFSAEELAHMRASLPSQHPFHQAVDACAQGQDELAGRLTAFLQTLQTLREARMLSVHELIWQMYDATGWYERVGLLPDGLSRQANLRALADRAAAYDGAQNGDLTGFIALLDKLSGSSDAELSPLPEGDDVLRIMTIHRSKGLEFPVVFAPNLAARLGGQTPPMLLQEEEGMGLMFVDGKTGIRRLSLARFACTMREELESAAEEMRLLYVLMTRARDRLILSASGAACDKFDDFLPLTPLLALDAPHYLAWLAPAARTSPLFTIHRHHAAPAFEAPLDEPCLSDDQQVPAWLLARLNWHYAYETTVLPLKVSVSQLEQDVEGEPGVLHLPDAPRAPRPVPRPAFLQKAALTPAERGSAMHSFLQAADFAAISNVPDDGLRALLETQRGLMEFTRRLSPAQSQAIDMKALTTFFASPLGRRLVAATTVLREKPFNLRLSARDFTLDGLPQTEEMLLVQGIIDVAFLVPTGWVLLDYKTDALFPGLSATDAAERHAPQLALYARALEALTPHPVIAQYVVLLKAGVSLRVNIPKEA